MGYVMIVDDDHDFATATAIVLESKGHEVQIELSTTQALADMLKRSPDLVILDVMFPEDSSAGFKMAREIRLQHVGLKRMPILILSAINCRFAIGFGRQDIDDEWLPVDDFLDKPVDFDTLIQRVSDLLAKAG